MRRGRDIATLGCRDWTFRGSRCFGWLMVGGGREASRCVHRLGLVSQSSLRVTTGERGDEEDLYGPTQCNKVRTTSLSDACPSYTSSRYRVIGPLSNNEDFLRAWSCKKGDAMDRHDKCSVGLCFFTPLCHWTDMRNRFGSTASASLALHCQPLAQAIY